MLPCLLRETRVYIFRAFDLAVLPSRNTMFSECDRVAAHPARASHLLRFLDDLPADIPVRLFHLALYEWHQPPCAADFHILY